MFIKKYKVITKEGKAHSQLFETVKDALKEIGVSKIGKIEELSVKEEVSDTLIDRKNVAIIARRTDAEIEASDKSGHSPTFTRPALTKVFEGMTLLELGEDKVLESSLSAFGRFESNMNKDWKEEYGGDVQLWDSKFTKPVKKTTEKKRPITEGPKATHAINADTGRPVKLTKTQQKSVGSYYSREQKPYSSGGLGTPKKPKTK